MKIAQIGETILAQKAQLVEADVFTTPAKHSDLTTFCGALLTTMIEANGVGIAAPQVFDPRAIMYIASRPNPRYPDAPAMEPLLLINPTIIEVSDTTNKSWEGCLSVPGIRGNITRPSSVKVSYQDLLGHTQTNVFEGFIARIFQHEFDHLIGKTWLDHIKHTKDIMANDVWLAHFG